MSKIPDDKLKLTLASLPEAPGIYQYFNEKGVILYIGKALNIKKRVSSYFTKQQHNAKTRALVGNISEIKYIVTNTELDALLLENSLIKEHQPRYNILLRDDKTYPWIVIRNEPFPRIYSTRNPVKDGSEYFGPYASVMAMRSLLELAKTLYPLRSCSYNLTQENIKAEKFRSCLEFHIGNCMAPCIGQQSETEYMEYIRQIRQIINGRLHEVKKIFTDRMFEHAMALEFERAQKIKVKLDALERYQSKTTVVSSKITDVDIVNLSRDNDSVYVNYMRIINGLLIHSHSAEARSTMGETDGEIIQHTLITMRTKYGSSAKEVVVPMALPVTMEELKITVPQRGEKKDLLKLSERNARFFMLDKQKQIKIKDPDRHVKRVLETLKNDLRLKDLPRHIECFDNSNIQGTNPVSACVVFRNARPAKQEYRHFNIRTVEGPNDFASMTEAVHRRYRRTLEEGHPLPDLLVIDGGKGQLSAALEALETLGIRGKLPVIGIAKKLEEIYFPGDSVPLHIDKRSESLKVIQYLRNEAHRFGLEHHRKKRSGSALKSELGDIDGIGAKTAQTLLRHFKSLNGIRNASIEELEAVAGKDKANKIRAYFGG